LSEPGIVHKPVLISSLLEYIHLEPDSVVVDATIGQAGHAIILGGQLGEKGLLVGLDVDSASLSLAKKRLADLTCRVELRRENFGNLDMVLEELGIRRVDLMLADIGISSAQLEDARRGISFQSEGPLDMRLDDRLETTAADLVNNLKQDDLANLIYRYGEERKSRRIARAIVETRRKKRLENTTELVDIVYRALGIRGRGGKYRIHPATRTFQALRIAVNDELGQLENLLEKAPGLLEKGGKIAVISFHSLEDRLVKNNFRENKKVGQYEILTRKPVVADEKERRENPRSRSAKLRVAKKTGNQTGVSE